MKKIVAAISVLAVLAISAPAFAHFQMIYTPESALDKGRKIPLVTKILGY